jgi:hypothetical protein
VPLGLVKIEASGGFVYRLSNRWLTLSEQDARAVLAHTMGRRDPVGDQISLASEI